jgi:hypothetical protein
MTENKLHPNHYIVPYPQLTKYRDTHDPENTSALCDECPEFRTPSPRDGCSDTCGSPNVYVGAETFVRMKLEGLV